MTACYRLVFQQHRLHSLLRRRMKPGYHMSWYVIVFRLRIGLYTRSSRSTRSSRRPPRSIAYYIPVSVLMIPGNSRHRLLEQDTRILVCLSVFRLRMMPSIRPSR